MDHDVLVEEQIEDGRLLLHELERVEYHVAVAGWIKLDEARLWKLCIGFDLADRYDEDEASCQVASTLSDLQLPTIRPSLLVFGSQEAPVFADLLALREKYPTMVATKLKTRRKIGPLKTRGLYIYPTNLDLADPSDVVHSVLQLLDRRGSATPSVVTFRDGSRIHAVPVGIRLNTPEGTRIDWHDVVTSQDRSVTADEVVSIL